MTLRITQYGESILHEKGKAVTDFSDKLFNLSRDMIDAMRHAEGIGLAAQQIGKALALLRDRGSRSSRLPDDLHP